MGYGLQGKFVNVKTKKVLFSVDLSFLKNLSAKSYSADFYDINSTCDLKNEDFPDACTYDAWDVKGIYSKDVLNKATFTKVTSKWFKHEKLDTYSISKEEFENNGNFDEYNKTYTPDSSTSENNIVIYTIGRKASSGRWYYPKDFETAYDKIKQEYEEDKTESIKLKIYEHTKDWFELSDKGKESYYERVRNKEESLEYSEQKFKAIIQILDYISFIEDNEDTENVELAIFIEVC